MPTCALEAAASELGLALALVRSALALSEIFGVVQEVARPALSVVQVEAA